MNEQIYREPKRNKEQENANLKYLKQTHLTCLSHFLHEISLPSKQPGEEDEHTFLMKASIPFFSTSILLKENSKIQSCFGLKIFKLTKPLPPWLFKGVQPSYLVRTTCSLLPIPPTPKINI